jgi:hypothetical protein
LVLALGGCYRGKGDNGDAAGEGGSGESAGSAGTADTGEVPPPPEEGGVGIMGLRRLTRDEYDNTVRDILFDDTRPGSTLLPEDVADPFDNAWQGQNASAALIQSLEALSIDITSRLLTDPARMDMVVGCTPVAADDQECLESFIASFGRRALRRPLDPEELGRYADLANYWITEQNDFYAGVEVVIRTFLQDPEFVYRVEIGSETDEPGVFALDDFEVATRLSYFVTGSTPDDELLDLAEAGMLSTPDDVRAAAEGLLADPRAGDRIDRFHALWLGYYKLPHAQELTTAMRTETRALLDEIIWNQQTSWIELFTQTGTFANDYLATHYGLPAPGTDEYVWVEYGDSGRQGLLSHGSFLSVAAKFGDTSPTQRGKLVRKRLFCQVIPPPPPDVNVDMPPVSPDSDCKYDRYEAHRSNGACAACHNLLDPVGFGLENYDQEGRWRATDNGLPECTISGDGDVDGTPFNGPSGLADILVEQNVLDGCVVDQVYEFAMGHDVFEEDVRYVDDLETVFVDGGRRFDVLMLDLVSDPAFLYRREEEA